MEFLNISRFVWDRSVPLFGGPSYLGAEPFNIRSVPVQEYRILVKSLLKSSLASCLKELERLLIRQRRSDWPAVCLGMCVVLLGAEKFQFDIHADGFLSELVTPGTSKATSLCEAMEMKAINRMVDLFHASTGGVSPLSFDWDSKRNLALVENNVETAAALRDLKRLSEDYCE